MFLSKEQEEKLKKSKNKKVYLNKLFKDKSKYIATYSDTFSREVFIFIYNQHIFSFKPASELATISVRRCLK